MNVHKREYNSLSGCPFHNGFCSLEILEAKKLHARTAFSWVLTASRAPKGPTMGFPLGTSVRNHAQSFYVAEQRRPSKQNQNASAKCKHTIKYTNNAETHREAHGCLFAIITVNITRAIPLRVDYGTPRSRLPQATQPVFVNSIELWLQGKIFPKMTGSAGFYYNFKIDLFCEKSWEVLGISYSAHSLGFHVLTNLGKLKLNSTCMAKIIKILVE